MRGKHGARWWGSIMLCEWSCSLSCFKRSQRLHRSLLRGHRTACLLLARLLPSPRSSL